MLGWTAVLFAQSPDSASFWQDISERDLDSQIDRAIDAEEKRLTILSVPDLRDHLARLDEVARGQGTLQLAVPHPSGRMDLFELTPGKTMSPELAVRFPEIQTFTGRTADGRSILYGDLTSQGFHAMVRQLDGDFYYVDPYIRHQDDIYTSYYRRHFIPVDNDFICHVTDLDGALPDVAPRDDAARIPIEGEMRTYRLAVACTGEYATFHGGTVPLAMAAIVTAINRVNSVYNIDAAVHMELIPNNEDIVYLDAATDPYSNSNPSLLLSQNQANLDSVIGFENYDVGHVFTTGGGGLAGLGVICTSGKARGETGLSNPIGDPFYIDFVAHELGHQFGGSHTFNGTSGNCSGGNRSGAHAYEPGSASTIQGYAGICSGQNLQNNSDPYFHIESIRQFYETTHRSGDCAQVAVIDNAAPDMEAGDSFNIPARTPFTLTAGGTDSDGNDITYCWEQFDLGPASAPGIDDGEVPLFRSFNPTTNPSRTFPRWSDLLAGTTNIGEHLPTTTRELTFRVTGRDNVVEGGGVDFDEVVLQVSNTAGPFVVTSQSSPTQWEAGSQQTVTWNVANTDAAPINATTVDILWTDDNGQTFIPVATNEPNDGEATITAPIGCNQTGRIKVMGTGNIFFNINSSDITLSGEGLGPWQEWSLDADEAVTPDRDGDGRIDILDLLRFCTG
ncbi:reprolysin-like metallopeptidase [Sulfidibacter corallicola]|uniref:EF-hand domain-containing protein n=1 Tax=Sulfidibacter corallicola TaxID=2818388 RepID=A0A8A4TM53_SULCO|nr:zinc-dependent metalloprotease family protein [Sulfidibacter corallicola]QTD50192.1 hypothetical protein J3U87_31795 [Sulfidibacter corallicola]